MTPDSVLLTPNQRLCLQLQRDYDALQSGNGRLTWQAPNISSIGLFLHQLWQDFTAMGVQPCADLWLLNEQQELHLWQSVVQKNAEDSLLATEAAARAAMQAYRTLALWQLDLTADKLHKRFHLQDDTAFFHHCAVSFRQLCAKNSCIAGADIFAVLATLPRPAYRHAVLYAFDEIVPAYSALFEAWNLPVQQAEPAGNTGHCRRVVCETERAEFASAAAWAEHVLDGDPDACIAIIVPELQSQRVSVEHEFTARFEPNYFHPQTARYVLPFNISAGVSLAGVPLVQSALRVLQLNGNCIATEDVPSLLYSPFLALDEDCLAARVELEHRLRNYQDASLDLGTLLYQCNSKGLQDEDLLCPALANSLRRFKMLQSGKRKTLEQWLDTFGAQLETFGWPGKRPLDSTEFQQLQRWYEALDDGCQLATLTGRLSAEAALQLLRDVLRQTVFQAQSGGSPIQILGLLEGAGQSFSHLWICGLSNSAWPPAARPSAFIPMSLQRELNMPHCGPEREFQFAHGLLENYRRSSATVVFSHAQQDEEQQLEPSALIAEVQRVPLHELIAPLAAESAPAAPVGLERIASGKAPAVQESELLRGGVAIYNNQAACPFRAFATHRLQATALLTACTGLSALQRGILVHHCLDYIWRSLGSQKTMRGKTASQRHKVIAAAVSDAIAALGKHMQPGGSMHAVLTLEQQRLQELLTMWLEREAERQPFVVKHCEYELQVDIAGRRKRLRIDRIDELEDGTQLIVDYKTGLVSIAGWQGEPLQDAQLPLYVLHLNSRQQHDVSGIALARVDIHEPRWLGVGSGADAGFAQSHGARARQDDTSWSEYLRDWHEGISALDYAFSEGEAAVRPLHGAASCRYCDLKLLCRIPKRSLDNNNGVTEHEP